MKITELKDDKKNMATLVALVEEGPLWDGDVPSKTERDALLENGLAVRVIVKGEDGFTAATYNGRDAYKKFLGVDTLHQAFELRKTKKSNV